MGSDRFVFLSRKLLAMLLSVSVHLIHIFHFIAVPISLLLRLLSLCVAFIALVRVFLRELCSATYMTAFLV